MPVYYEKETVLSDKNKSYKKNSASYDRNIGGLFFDEKIYDRTKNSNRQLHSLLF